MTAVPAPAPQSRSPLLALLLAAVLLAAGVKVTPRMHAVVKHGLEAVAIRDSCDGGADYIFQSLSPKTPNKFLELCALEDGRWGIRIIECVGRRWIERTAFVPKGTLGDGTWERAMEYISGKARPWSGKLSKVCK